MSFSNDFLPLHTIQLPHAGSWSSRVSFSPNGHLIACVSSDASVVIYNYTTTTTTASPDSKITTTKSATQSDPICLYAIVSGHTGWVCSAEFSPDSKWLASASSDRTVRIWSTQKQKCIKVLSHIDLLSYACWSPHGQWLAVACSSTDYKCETSVCVWDTSSWVRVACFPLGHFESVNQMVFHPDSSVLFCASDNGAIQVYDCDSWICTQILKGHSGQVTSISMSNDGVMLASSSTDTTVRIWECTHAAWSCSQIICTRAAHVRSVDFNGDNSILAIGSGSRIHLYTAGTTGARCSTGSRTWTLVSQCKLHRKPVLTVCFAPQRPQTLLSCSSDCMIHISGIVTNHDRVMVLFPSRHRHLWPTKRRKQLKIRSTVKRKAPITGKNKLNAVVHSFFSSELFDMNVLRIIRSFL
jgi:WD40 repeat protein